MGSRDCTCTTHLGPMMPARRSLAHALNIDLPSTPWSSAALAAWFKQSNLDFQCLLSANSCDRFAIWQQQEEERLKALRRVQSVDNNASLSDEDSEASSSDGESNASTMLASSCYDFDTEEDSFSEDEVDTTV